MKCSLVPLFIYCEFQYINNEIFPTTRNFTWYSYVGWLVLESFRILLYWYIYFSNSNRVITHHSRANLTTRVNSLFYLNLDVVAQWYFTVNFSACLGKPFSSPDAWGLIARLGWSKKGKCLKCSWEQTVFDSNCKNKHFEVKNVKK